MPFMAAAAPYLLAGGALISGVSAISSGIQQSASMKAQAEGADYNRQAALQSAAATEEAGKYEEEKQRKEGLRLLGAQKAAYGKAGVEMEGTPLEVVAQTAADLEEKALATRYNYQVQSNRYRSQANFFDYEADRDRSMAGYPLTAGFMKAGTSLLNAGAQWGLKSGAWNTGNKAGLSWNPFASMN